MASGRLPRLVKLQRPPPEIRIFLPTLSACSSTSTRRPRRPARRAHTTPAAPPPATTTTERPRPTPRAGARAARDDDAVAHNAHASSVFTIQSPNPRPAIAPATEPPT